MANLLIDGYNLIGIGHNDLEAARNDIIEKLKRYSSIKKHDITIVFDAWKRGESAETRTKTGRLTVIYSRVAEKADDVIIKMTKIPDKAWIVISSDREIYDFALRNDIAAISSEDFERKLFAALKNTDEEVIYHEDDDEEDLPNGSRGNPRRLSKKDRRRMQAFNKL